MYVDLCMLRRSANMLPWHNMTLWSKSGPLGAIWIRKERKEKKEKKRKERKENDMAIKYVYLIRTISVLRYGCI